MYLMHTHPHKVSGLSHGSGASYRFSISAFRTPYMLLAVAVPALSGTARGLIVPGLRLSEVLSVMLLAYVLLVAGKRFHFRSAGIWSIVLYCATFSIAGLWHFVDRPSLSYSYMGEEVVVVWQYGFIALALMNVFSLDGAQDRLRSLVHSVGFWASINSILAVLQILRFAPAQAIGATLTGNSLILDTPNWKVPRGTGLFPSWHALGAFLALALSVLLFAALSDQFTRADRRIAFVSLVVTTTGLASSLTATPILLTGGVALALTLRYRKRWPLYSLVLAAVGMLMVEPVAKLVEERVVLQSANQSDSFLPQTIEYRINVWMSDYIPVIRENFWLGYGSLDGSISLFEYAESMYIWLLFQGGAVLLGAFGIMYLGVLGSLWKSSAYQSNALGEDFNFMVRAAMVTLLPLMAIHPYLKDAGGSQMFFCLVGIGLGLTHRNAHESGTYGNASRPPGSPSVIQPLAKFDQYPPGGTINGD